MQDKQNNASGAKTAQPEKRGFFSFLRHPFGGHKPEPKPAEPDLRRRVCLNGSCKEKEDEKRPVESNLRRRICLDGPCKECPPGQSAGKNGGCSTARVTTASNVCQANEYWNGGACTYYSNSCRVGEVWNGVTCMENWNRCAGVTGRAAALANELRGIQADVRASCSSTPSGQQCSDTKLRQDGAILRYRMLLNEAPLECRTMMPDPLSLM